MAYLATSKNRRVFIFAEKPILSDDGNYYPNTRCGGNTNGVRISMKHCIALCGRRLSYKDGAVKI